MTDVSTPQIAETDMIGLFNDARRRYEGVVSDLAREAIPLIEAVREAQERYEALKLEQRELPERARDAAIGAMVSEDGAELNSLRHRQGELEYLVSGAYLSLLRSKLALASLKLTTLSKNASAARRELAGISSLRRELDRAQSRAAGAAEVLATAARDGAEEVRATQAKIDALTERARA
jgi:hypothetical protein